MTVSTHTYTAELLGPSGAPLDVSGGSITLDEKSSPHVQATLELGAPAESILTALDPRLGVRVRLTADASFPTGAQQRVFDLTLRDRPVQHDDTGSVSLSLASDEALADDWRTLADDSGASGMASSVRSICEYVLGKVPTILSNLEPNPRALPGVNDAPYGTRFGWARIYGTGHQWAPGANTWAFFSANETGSVAGRGVDSYGNMDIGTPGTSGDWVAGPVVTPGETITVSRYAVTNISNPDGFVLLIRFHNGAGAWVGSAQGASGQGDRPSITVTVPPGAVRFSVSLRLNGNNPVSVTSGTSVVVMTGLLTERSDTLRTWRDKVLDVLSPIWIDASLTSPDPDALIWRAGDSAMDFLRPLVQAVGLRLVCDETRSWTLRTEEYNSGGDTLSIRYGINLIEGSDVISLDDESWFDARVTRYRWTDSGGVARVATDSYALHTPPRLVSRVDIDAPYPGPGRSEYAVRRAQGRGREVSATVVADWRTKAEQTTQIVLEGAPLLVGETSQVVFDLSMDRMTITTRTIDVPAGAIDLLAGTINGLAGTIDGL